jgi:hypothetical protein
VKQVADTVFVVLGDASSALSAALDAQRVLVEDDARFAARHGAAGADRVVSGHGHAHGHPSRDVLRGCMGLGYGEALVIPGRDIFGSEVNRAFILGEDVAGGGEVLMTEAFLAAVGELPSGVGAFCAPGDRARAAGFAFRVVADYR